MANSVPWLGIRKWTRDFRNWVYVGLTYSIHVIRVTLWQMKQEGWPTGSKRDSMFTLNSKRAHELLKEYEAEERNGQSKD